MSMCHKTLSAVVASRWPPGWLYHGCTCAQQAAQSRDACNAFSAKADRLYVPLTSAVGTNNSRNEPGGQQDQTARNPSVGDAAAARHKHTNMNCPTFGGLRTHCAPDETITLGHTTLRQSVEANACPARRDGTAALGQGGEGGGRVRPPPHKPRWHYERCNTAKHNTSHVHNTPRPNSPAKAQPEAILNAS